MEAASRPAPGKWSQKEIIGHLIDSASNNHGRFVRAQLQDDLIFAGYDQDAELFDALLAVIEDSARAAVAAGDPPIELNTWGVDPSRSAEERGSSRPSPPAIHTSRRTYSSPYLLKTSRGSVSWVASSRLLIAKAPFPRP